MIPNIETLTLYPLNGNLLSLKEKPEKGQNKAKNLSILMLLKRLTLPVE
jgi:hypothetical protein